MAARAAPHWLRFLLLSPYSCSAAHYVAWPSVRIPAPRAPAALLSTAVDPVALKDYGQAAVTFFSNMRVPAALIAAAAIKDAFALQKAPEDIKHSSAWTALRNAYILLQMTAFTAELSVVVFATSAIAKLTLASTRMEMSAPSLTELLRTQLEYEYVGVQCDFLSGILSFLLASALRFRFALRKSQLLSLTGMWLIIYRATILLTYSNIHMLAEAGGFTALLRRRATLQLELMQQRLLAGPGSLLSIFALAYGSVSLVRLLARSFLQVRAPPESTSWRIGAAVPSARIARSPRITPCMQSVGERRQW